MEYIGERLHDYREKESQFIEGAITRRKRDRKLFLFHASLESTKLESYANISSKYIWILSYQVFS